MMKINKLFTKNYFTKKAYFLLLVACVFSFCFTDSAKASSETFLVDSTYDRYGRSEVDATLLHTSDNAYFYVDDKYYDDLSYAGKSAFLKRIEEVADTFDTVIYKKIRNVFGSEWSPGIDEDEKITIFFTKLDYNVGGYFNPNDEYNKERVINEESNEREMIYMNPDFINDARIEGFVAHEFQHMITWNKKTQENNVVEEIWLNESRSELASSIIEEYIGTEFLKSNLYAREKIFTLNYQDSLIDWNNENYDYGTVSIFAQYIKDRFGSEIFREITSNSKTGIDSIDYVLDKEYDLTFEDVFTDWLIANYINDAEIDNSYSYTNEYLDEQIVKPTTIKIARNDSDISIEDNVNNWGSVYYKINLKEKEGHYIDIDFNGTNAGEFVSAYVLEYDNGDKEVKFLNLNSRQDGSIEITPENNRAIEYITLIVSNEDREEDNDDLESNQVGSYNFNIEIKTTLTSNQVITSLDGLLIRIINQEKVYLVENGKLRWIKDSATFARKGYNWADVIVVNVEDIDNYEIGENISYEINNDLEGKLVIGNGPKVYMIENGQLRWIENENIFNSYGFSWNNIISISEQELNSYALGDNLSVSNFTNGDLIKGNGPEIYLFENGKLRWITSPGIFDRNGYSWSSIIEVSGDILSSMEKADSII